MSENKRKTKIIKMMIEEGSDDYILIEVPDDDNIEVPEKTPPGRCVDCRWAKSSVKVNVYDHGSSIIFGYCEHPEIEGCEWSINYNKKTPIISFLRQPCTSLLPDGSYGFEPAEVEEEDE